MALLPEKRQSGGRNDDDVEEGSSQEAAATAKRVKRERGLANGHSRGSSRTPRHSRGPSKTPRRSARSGAESDFSDSDASFETPLADDDEEEEEEPTVFNDDDANVRAYHEAKEKGGNIYGWESDAGTIKQVILIDFMCHRHFSVELGNRMNFVVGHNGSGKSAVLTAIAVALGGKAAITGRGQGLKDLIRREADKAVVTIIMSNEGPEAFKPELYGSQIVIERTLHKNGSSGYKFRATREGRIIASKREELNEICSNFTITIDSPLTILTQDNARSFLQNATDEALYKFFLEGTQLESLWAAYDKLSLQADQLLLHSTRQKESIPDRQLEVDQLGRRAQANQKIIELVKKLAEIEIEMAWAYIRDKENELEDNNKQYNELAEKVGTVQQKLKACEEEYETLDAQVKEADKELKTFESGKTPLQQRKNTAKTKLTAAEGILKRTKGEVKKQEALIRDHKKALAHLDRDIAEKQAELNQAESEQQRKVRLDLDRHRDLVKKLEEDNPRKEKLLKELREQLQKIDREIDDLNNKRAAAGGKNQEIDRRIEGLRRQTGNRLQAFGQSIDQLHRAIDRSTWKGAKPIGPLGMSVNLDDPLYATVISATMGNTLCGFAVTTPDDQRQLMRLMDQIKQYRPGTGNNQKVVITHTGDRFEWSRGHLVNYAPTILSKLRIEDEDVLRILINQHNIERTFISPNLKHANGDLDRLIGRGLPQATYITADGYRTTSIKGRGVGSQPTEQWRGNSLFAKDLAAEIAELERQKGADNELDARLVTDLKEAQARRSEKQAEIDRTDGLYKRAKNGLNSALNMIQKLEGQIEERPDDAIGGLELSKMERQKELETAEQNLKELQEELPGHEESIQKLTDEHDDLHRQIEDFGPESQKRSDALTILRGNKTRAQNEVKRWTDSVANYRTKLEEKAEDKTRAAEELEDWTQQATNMHGQRASTRRNIDVLQKDKAGMQKAKAEAEKRQGVTAEDLMPVYQKAKDDLYALKAQAKSFEDIALHFRRFVKARRRWWGLQRDMTAIRARTKFIVNLQNRQLSGILEFDHKRKKLGVRVYGHGQKKDAANQAPAQFKVPRNLSGGERSFSTVSLLLALWDTASSPIRCLDEWDVFLDAGNRGVAAKMLVEGAQDSSGKQFILITPLDLHGVRCEGPGNKQIRLDDPVRNQSTLNFAPA